MKNISSEQHRVEQGMAGSQASSVDAKAAFFNALKTVLVMIVVSAGVNGIIQFDVYFENGISEASLTENTQLLCLAIAFISFARIAHYRPDLKNALALACGLFAVMFVRETDNTLDFIVHGFWKYPATLVVLIAIGYALSNRKNLIAQMAVLANSKSVNLVIASIILLIVFSRLFGMATLWKTVMGDDYVRLAKSIAEEGTELLAYALIAVTSIKTLREFKRS